MQKAIKLGSSLVAFDHTIGSCELVIVEPAFESESYYRPATSATVSGLYRLKELQKFLGEAIAEYEKESAAARAAAVDD